MRPWDPARELEEQLAPPSLLAEIGRAAMAILAGLSICFWLWMLS